MRSTFATLALVGAAAAQGVGNIAPSTSAPAGCSSNYAGTFTFQVLNVTTSGKRSLEARADGDLVVSLKNGVFTDDKGRIGAVVANTQIQFDGPPAQAGSKYTAGWSVCGNNTIALGSQVIFYQCLSGNFFNLYQTSQGAQCSPIYIQAASLSSNSGQMGDGQVTAGRPATQIGDGQVQATTGAGAVTQIGDGQIQAPTGKPVTQISDGQIQAPKTTPTAAPTRPANGTVTTSKGPIAATGAAVANAVGAFGIFAGAVAVALL